MRALPGRQEAGRTASVPLLGAFLTRAASVHCPPTLTGGTMPILMTHATYSQAGVKGLAQDGGSKRKAAIKQMVEAVGGKLHALYFAFGDSDIVLIAEYPDNATAASVALAVGGAGVISSFRSMVLLTPEEVDAATKKSVAYRAPGAQG